jgi:hypothetical protein
MVGGLIGLVVTNRLRINYLKGALFGSSVGFGLGFQDTQKVFLNLTEADQRR